MLAIVVAGLVRSQVSTIGNRTDMWLSKCTSVQISNITKVCVQNVLRVLECKLKDVDATAWSLHRHVPSGNVPTLLSGIISAGSSWFQLWYTRSCSLPQIWWSTGFRSGLFAPYHFSCLSILIKTRSSAENTMHIVYDNCWLRQHNVISGHVTAVTNAVLETKIFCHRDLNINDSAIKLYFLMKFGSTFTVTFWNKST